MPRKGAGALLMVAGLVFVLLAIEGVLHMIDRKSTFRDWHWNSYTYLLDEFTDWKLEPKLYAFGQINRFHFRGAELNVEKSPEVYRIVIVGGSAAFDLWKQDSETWTAQLESKLNGDQIRKVEVLNAATPGYSSWQVLNLMKSRLIAWKPDMVLLYELYNDSLTFGHDNRQQIIEGWKLNGEANYAGWFSTRHPSLELFSKILPETVDLIRLTAVLMHQSDAGQKNDQFWSNPKLDRTLQEAGFLFYKDNRTSLARFLEDNGKIPLGIISQISLIKEKNTPEEEAKIHYIYRGLNHQNLWNGYQRAREIDRMISEEKPNVFLIPAHENIPASFEILTDEVHLNKKGSSLLADFVARELRQRIKGR